MLPISVQNKLNYIKSNCLVFDIETSSYYPDGREVNIKTNFDDYVANAKVKWFGAFSYKNNKGYYLNAITQSNEIVQLLSSHNVIVGFNSEEFDFPIISNNGLTNLHSRYTQVDLMSVMGTMSQKNKKGFAFKGRGELMNYKFKNNSLRCMAETMKLEHQKGDIDFKIFHKNSWTDAEVLEIKKYLYSDVMAEKQIFDKLWNYWMPFAELLNEKYVYDLSWIKSSIASLTYKAACKVLNVEPTYAEKQLTTEEMGGNVITPKYEESTGVWYIDFASLYPHIFSMFNLPAEVKEDSVANYEKVWHGNEIFQVKGHYDISSHHSLSKYISEKLKERIALQKKDPTSSMIYTLKILLNGLYGVMRSPIFERVHTPNCGWDCCWLGKQIQDFTKERLEYFGFETIYGDTDSLMIVCKDKENNNREYVQDCLNQIIEIINDYVPFKVDTFSIKIENYLDYVMFPFSDQPVIDEETGENKKIKNRLVRERKGKKKNYLYVYKDEDKTKVKLIGLPLIKDNATPLGLKIFNEVLEKEIIENKKAKFSKKYIDDIINDYLKRKEVIESLTIEYKIQKFDSYKNPNQIQAQISKEYFAGETGRINLIKNNKVGKVGKGEKYCTIEEAYANNLTANEFDLEKLYNELDPFIIYEPKVIEEKVKIVKEEKRQKSRQSVAIEAFANGGKGAITNEDMTQIRNNEVDESSVVENVCSYIEVDITQFPKPKNIIYPFKWPGNKKDLLSILQEVLKQSNCTKIHEAFAGSAVFSLNTNITSATIADTNKHLYELWLNIKNNLKELIRIIASYDTARIKDDQNYYNEIRSKFNTISSGIEKSALFHILLGSCTNNLARFNQKGEFNQTWGNRHAKHTLEDLEDLVKNFTIKFQSYEQTQVDNDTLLYLDPPYLLSNDCYTACAWNEIEEEIFLNWLSAIKTKWCLSNIITKDTRTNDLLKEFGKRYHVYYLSKKYNAKVGGYDKKEDHQSQEVLITNFPVNFEKKSETIELKENVERVELVNNVKETINLKELYKKYSYKKSEHKFPYCWTLKDTIFTKDKGKVFSCFSCGGGSTMGYKLAGFDVIGCNEIDKKMFDLYVLNHHPKFAYNEDIRVFKNRTDLPKELYDLDILDGSPPCSSFSIAGNRDKDWGKTKKFREGQEEQILDTLFFDFIELGSKLKPKIMIAENVKGLLMGTAKEYVHKIYQSFDLAGYTCTHTLLNSKDMGVPQRRERVFFVAIRKDLPYSWFHLDLSFNEKEIPIKNFIKGLPKKNTQNFSKTRFGDVMLDIERSANTVTRDARFWLDENTLIDDTSKLLIGSFPLDYNFNQKDCQYVIGMSVPPIMMAQIASQIYKQLLSQNT